MAPIKETFLSEMRSKEFGENSLSQNDVSDAVEGEIDVKNLLSNEAIEGADSEIYDRGSSVKSKFKGDGS